MYENMINAKYAINVLFIIYMNVRRKEKSQNIYR